jgi:hypothetical protein
VDDLGTVLLHLGWGILDIASRAAATGRISYQFNHLSLVSTEGSLALL